MHQTIDYHDEDAEELGHEPTPDEAAFVREVVAAIPRVGHAPFYGRFDIFYDNKGDLAVNERSIKSCDLMMRRNPEAASLLAKQLDLYLQKCECEPDDGEL